MSYVPAGAAREAAMQKMQAKQRTAAAAADYARDMLPANLPPARATPSIARREAKPPTGTRQGPKLPSSNPSTRRAPSTPTDPATARPRVAVVLPETPPERRVTPITSLPKTAHQSRQPVAAVIHTHERVGLDLVRRPEDRPSTTVGPVAISGLPAQRARPGDGAQVRHTGLSGLDLAPYREPAELVRRETRITRLRRGSTMPPADPRASREPRATAPSIPAPPTADIVAATAPRPEPPATRTTASAVDATEAAVRAQRETPPGPHAPVVRPPHMSGPVAQPPEGLPGGLSTTKTAGNSPAATLGSGRAARPGPANQPGVSRAANYADQVDPGGHRRGNGLGLIGDAIADLIDALVDALTGRRRDNNGTTAH